MYCCSAAVASVRLVRNTAYKFTRRVGGCEWANLEVMDYIGKSNFLDFCRSCTFPDEGEVVASGFELRMKSDGMLWIGYANGEIGNNCGTSRPGST